jgi:hypothetical protein
MNGTIKLQGLSVVALRRTRAVEQLRSAMGELYVADVRPQVLLYNATDFENYTLFKPTETHEKVLNSMLDKLIAWV